MQKGHRSNMGQCCREASESRTKIALLIIRERAQTDVQKLIHQWLLQHRVHMDRVLHSCWTKLQRHVLINIRWLILYVTVSSPASVRTRQHTADKMQRAKGKRQTAYLMADGVRQNNRPRIQTLGQRLR